MQWPKKNEEKMITRKKFLRPENSPPPNNFSNGPSLRYSHVVLRQGNKIELLSKTGYVF